MKNSKLKTIFLSLLAAFWLFGCQEKESPPEIINPPVVTVSGIPAAGFSFLYFEQTEKTFTVESDSPWEITKTDGWFTISPFKGKAGTTTVKVFVVGNNDVARNGEFTVTANSGTLLKPVEESQTFKISQGAYRDAGISITGLTEYEFMFDADDPGSLSFDVLTTFPWSITLSDNSWFKVSPLNGNGGTSVTITVTYEVNPLPDLRECTLTIATADPENPANSDEKVIELRQRAHSDFDKNIAVGTVLFEDDFNWIIPLWAAANPKYGWPTVASEASVTGAPGPNLTTNNEYAYTTAQMNPRGWTFASAYARAEGWVKLGAASALGHVTTRALTEIAQGKVVNLLVSFDGSVYSSAGGTVDTRTFTVSVIGDGTINNTGEQSMNFTLQTHFGFDKYYFLVMGATASTQIRFGRILDAGETVSNTRQILDNFKIVRAENFNPVLPATAPVTLPLDYAVKDRTAATAYNAGNVIAAGATLTYSIRVNRAWTATPSASWLKFTQVFSGAAANGGSATGGIGAATATALTYYNCFVVVDPNTSSSRTATITIASGGQTIETITITQEGASSADNITLTGITADKVTLAAESPSIVLFKVNATSAWTLSYTDTWYTILPVDGVPNKDVEVVLVPKTNSGTPRSGSFTITAGSVTKTVTVEQAGLAPTEVVLASWMLPFKGTAPASGTNTYYQNFVALDGTADIGLGQWWVKSDDGKSILKGSRAKEDPGTQVYMSYSTYAAGAGQDRIIMYGLAQGDYWQMEIPTTGIEAGSAIKIETHMQGSGTGARDYLFRYSTDKQNWTNINTKTTGTIVYTVQLLPSASTIPISETFTIGSAIPAGTFYIQFLVNSSINTNGATIGLGGTSWITRPAHTSDADKVPIMKVTKL